MPKPNLLKAILEDTRRNVSRCFDQEIERIEEVGRRLRDQGVLKAGEQTRPGFRNAGLREIVAPFDDCDASLVAQKLREIADEVDGKIANVKVGNHE
jgi:hypothetical protein